MRERAIQLVQVVTGNEAGSGCPVLCVEGCWFRGTTPSLPTLAGWVTLSAGTRDAGQGILDARARFLAVAGHPDVLAPLITTVITMCDYSSTIESLSSFLIGPVCLPASTFLTGGYHRQHRPIQSAADRSPPHRAYQ